MERKIITALLLLSMTGCMNQCTPKPCPTVPHFEMPTRPVLVSDGQGDFDMVSKNVETDLIDIKTYASQLENILKTLKMSESINKTEVDTLK